MKVSEVRIKLMDDPQDRLKAFCSITFESSFVIRDLKIIMGLKGPFVAMPSRKLMDRCPGCHTKNHLRANYCNQCGTSLEGERAMKNDDGRAKLYADIAHPINSKCRDTIQKEVLIAFEKELVSSKLEHYICKYDDYGEEQYAMLKVVEEATEKPAEQTLSTKQNIPPVVVTSVIASSKPDEKKQTPVELPAPANQSIHRRLDTSSTTSTSSQPMADDTESSKVRVCTAPESSPGVTETKEADEFGSGIISSS